MGFISSLFGYVLNFLYELINNYGIAIILFSVLLKLILIPITIKQQKTLRKSSEMQAEMKKIQFKYKNNPEKMNQEMMDLYKREKTSPFSGCLSSILQLIIILSVFWLVSQPLTYMKKVDPSVIEEYKKQVVEENNGQQIAYPEIAIIERKGGQDERVNINMEFLGLDLSKVPTQSLNDWKVYVIPGLYVITSFISIKMTTKQQKDMMAKNKKEAADNDGNEPDPMENMQQMSNSMMYMMPIMSITIAVIAPLGLALYWLVSNILMIFERLIINAVMKKVEEKKEKEEPKRITEAKEVKVEKVENVKANKKQKNS